MKLKKHISRFLFCSMLFNNISFYSNTASNSNLSRYETLEGEIIDLGDTKSEDVTEIEIFGNTVQDPNNLEDIQSVGELYVDEKGEPILDSKGREQYKIEIETINCVNLFDANNVTVDKADTISNIFIPVYPGEKLTSTSSRSDGWMKFDLYDINKVKKYENFGNIQSSKCTITIPEGIYYVKPSFSVLAMSNAMTVRGDKIFNYEPYIPQESNKIAILLPCQLMKIGNVADRLYWNNEKGKYIVEKVFSEKPHKLTQAINPTWVMDDYVIFRFNSFSGMKNSPAVLCNRLSNNQKIIPSIHGNGAYTRIHMPISVDTKELFQSWIDEKDAYIWYQLNTPQLIETNITNKIKLKTYPEKTYVSTVSNNEVKPTLKILVDRIEQVSQEAVNQAESNSTSSNTSLARMFVNQLPESTYKDQLQDKLNNLFSKDMVLEKYNSTANLDVYIKSENLLSMSLDTNAVTFEDYSGLDELEIENAINISINSSLPYSLNAYVVGNITNNDKSKTMDLDVLNIRDSNQVDYKKFNSINSKLIILDNVNKGNNINHNIDLKLSGNKAYDADIYKTTIKFEAEQK